MLIGRRRPTTTPCLICTPKWPLPREPVAASMWPNQWRTTELPSKLIRTRPCSSRGPTIFQFFGFQPHNQAGYSAKPIPRNSRLAPVSCKTRTIPLRLGPPPTHGVAEAGLARRSEFLELRRIVTSVAHSVDSLFWKARFSILRGSRRSICLEEPAHVSNSVLRFSGHGSCARRANRKLHV